MDLTAASGAVARDQPINHDQWRALRLVGYGEEDEAEDSVEGSAASG